MASNMKAIWLPRLKVPCPSPLHFIADNQDILNHWEKHIAMNPLRDMRQDKGVPYSVHLLDRSRLQYEVEDGENIKIIDEETGKIDLEVVQNVV